jgi:hypothetical protein
MARPGSNLTSGNGKSKVGDAAKVGKAAEAVGKAEEAV